MRLLLVDDDEVIRDVLSDILTDEGFEVDEASDPEKALSVLQTDAPSVLVTDINLGTPMSGFDLARAAHHLWPPVGVVIISGLPENRNRYQFAPGDVFLPKPFDMGALVRAIRGFQPAPQ